MNGSMLILTNNLLNFGNNVGSCVAEPSCTFLVIKRCLTSSNRSCHSNTHVLAHVFPPILVQSLPMSLLHFSLDLHTHCSFCGSTWNLTHHIHDFKQKDVISQLVHSLAWNCEHWSPRYASTTIYCCVALLNCCPSKTSPKYFWLQPCMSIIFSSKFCV